MQVSPELVYDMLTMPTANNALADAMNNLTGNDFGAGLELLSWCACTVYTLSTSSAHRNPPKAAS
jgi:hypothetical protein